MIGIVASRLVERFGRPVVLIAGEGDRWKGSGRSVPRFDLHAGLAACADHLERFGGHRAAAGLSIAPDQLEPFARAFSAYADGVLEDEDLGSETHIDAIVPALALTLDLARELEQLAPFGLGNPDVTLLVADCEAVGASTVGDGSISASGCGSRAGTPGVRSPSVSAASSTACGRNPLRRRLSPQAEPMERNGRTTLVVRRIFDTADAYGELRAWLAGLWRAGDAAWTPEAGRIFSELRSRAAESGSCSNLPRSATSLPTVRRSAFLRPRRRPADSRGKRSSATRVTGGGARPRYRPLDLGEQPEHPATFDVPAEGVMASVLSAHLARSCHPKERRRVD